MDVLKRISIFFCLVLSALTIALSVGALFTDFWFEATELKRNGTQSLYSYVHSGLFHGTRQIEWSFAPRYTQFSVLDEIQKGVSFIGKTQWIFLIFLIVLSIFWTSIELLVSLLNTVVHDSKNVTGPASICLWSIFSIVSNGMAMILFLNSFDSTIQKNVLLEEHIRAGFSSEGKTHLSFSFWLLVGSIVIQFFPIIFTFFTFRCSTKKCNNSIQDLQKSYHDTTILMY